MAGRDRRLPAPSTLRPGTTRRRRARSHRGPRASVDRHAPLPVGPDPKYTVSHGRQAGLPIESARGPYGGYRVGRGLRLPPLMFGCGRTASTVSSQSRSLRTPSAHPTTSTRPPSARSISPSATRTTSRSSSTRPASRWRRACPAPWDGSNRSTPGPAVWSAAPATRCGTSSSSRRSRRRNRIVRSPSSRRLRASSGHRAESATGVRHQGRGREDDPTVLSTEAGEGVPCFAAQLLELCVVDHVPERPRPDVGVHPVVQRRERATPSIRRTVTSGKADAMICRSCSHVPSENGARRASAGSSPRSRRRRSPGLRRTSARTG